MDDHIIYGIAGTVVSGSGVATIAEAENIWYSRIGFIITVIGFIISVVIPFILKIVKKIKDAKADADDSDVVASAPQGDSDDEDVDDD